MRQSTKGICERRDDFKNEGPENERDQNLMRRRKTIIPAQTDFPQNQEHDRRPERNADEIVEVELAEGVGKKWLDYPAIEKIDGHA